MTSWTTLVVLSALTAVGAAVALRVRWLKARPALVGLLFGLLALVFPFFPIVASEYYEIVVSLRVAPVLVAGFLFGPRAALTSGALACLSCSLGVFDGDPELLAICDFFGTAAVALFAAVLGRWVFLGRCPPSCTAAIAAVFGVVVYLTVAALFGLRDLPTTLEIVLASFLPVSAGSALSAGLAAVVCGAWRKWWRGFFSSLNLGFVLLALAVAGTTTIVALNAKSQGEAIVRHAVIDLSVELENQLRYMLHEAAVNFADGVAHFARVPEREKILAFGRAAGIAEISVADTNGIVLVTTEKGLSPGDVLERDAEVLSDYQDMCARAARPGPEVPFVSRPYQPTDAMTNDWVKQFAYPLPAVGFVRLGYRWSQFHLKFPQYILPALEGRKIGETGCFLTFDAHGRMVTSAPDRPGTKGLCYADIGLDEKALARPRETVFLVRIFGAMSRCVPFETFGGYRTFAVLPLAETQGPALVISTIVAISLMLVGIVFRVVLVRFQQDRSKIDALRAEKDRLRAADLEIARVIQRAELRTDGVEGDGYRLCASMRAAREVGGDFYDYYGLPDGRLVMTIADVSGKGIPAAFFMMKSRLTLQSCVRECATLPEAIARANVLLSANNPADMFVTAWVGVYDRRRGTLEYVSAGHNPPIRVGRSGGVRWIPAPRMAALGVFAKARYRSEFLELEPGERLFLYTDGVNEAMDARGALFGNDRLLATVSGATGSLVEAVGSAVDAFAAGAEQADDITMLEIDLA